jgi:hypothetical protein
VESFQAGFQVQLQAAIASLYGTVCAKPCFAVDTTVLNAEQVADTILDLLADFHVDSDPDLSARGRFCTTSEMASACAAGVNGRVFRLFNGCHAVVPLPVPLLTPLSPADKSQKGVPEVPPRRRTIITFAHGQ